MKLAILPIAMSTVQTEATVNGVLSNVGSQAGPVESEQPLVVHTPSEKRVTEERRDVMQQVIENLRGDALYVATGVCIQETEAQ